MIKLDTFKLQVTKGRQEVSITPHEYRILYLLHYLDSITVRGLADELEISPQQVKTHVCVLNTKLEGIEGKRLKTKVIKGIHVYLAGEKIRILHKF